MSSKGRFALLAGLLTLTLVANVSTMSRGAAVALASSGQETAGVQQQADRVLKQTRFIKDPRLTPPQCYVYFQSNEGASLATVSCSAVPKELLTEGRP